MAILAKIKDKTYAIKEHKHLVVWHEVLRVYMIVLLVWGFYRLLSPFPVWVEEIFLKGLVFGLPVLVVTRRKLHWTWGKLGLTRKHWAKGAVMGLGLGLLMGLVSQLGQLARGGGVDVWQALTVVEIMKVFGLAVVTAFWEQLLFSGYVLQRLEEAMPDEWSLSWVTGLLFVLLHVPALLLVREVAFMSGLTQLLLLFSLGLANSLLMLRTRSLLAPIMAQSMWGMTIYLFG